nr:Rha family transcriptional regulator [Lactobacillus intestinalis]
MKLLNFEGDSVLDSRDVAKMVGKRHTDLLRSIDSYIEDISQNAILRFDKFFIPSTYQSGTGKKYKNYLLTRQGCEFVANKMTGKKGNQFTAQYVSIFNQMKDNLQHPSSKPSLTDKDERLKIMKQNARTRKANLLFKIAQETESKTAKQALLAEAAEVLTGRHMIPIMQTHYYSAGQVGRQLGITANKVGRIANKLGLKCEQPGQNQYGRWANSKSQHSDKEVAQWLYTDEGLYQVKTYLKMWEVMK